MPLPTFFILGAPKCGTTALAQILGSHPDVFISRPKEPHFFDSSYDKGLPAYVSGCFAGWDGHGAAGEATPSYLAVPYVPARIHKDIPAARLIAILRDPVERAFSSWWMLYARGMEPLSFEEAIRENEAALGRAGAGQLEASESAWRAHMADVAAGKPIHIRNYLDGGYYARHLRRYLEYFPREQLKVVFSQDLRCDPKGTIRALWRHIGVREDAAVASHSASNQAVGAAARPLLAAARAIGVMRLRSLLPEPARNWIKKGLSGLGSLPQIDPATRRHLTAHFEPHVVELEHLLGIDLTAWRR